ncbi:alpha-N-acetylglucosaminidase [Pseudoxanthomonas helianthi]|uniref:Alpha-N-acetylglucosaminidase n=1 Tax=Pseudoxanthomonas helianthi TaxID=1453541 RepID=A0A940X2Q5_9GAMM|nr:alpha-N-acetylglucosaminidase [Pseudoxanthomonas helianthi]MBP3983530.1 alpha-N-acetylglucosaminidase [Pseudoxanthomonas helianthi]
MRASPPANPERRRLLKGAALSGIAIAGVRWWPEARAAIDGEADVRPLRDALGRLLPDHAEQIVWQPIATHDGIDRFEIDRDRDRLLIRSNRALSGLAGLHWYLKYVADAHLSWTGTQLDLPARLPLPARRIAMAAQLPHRYLLNDTDDGYSGPYRNWNDWERLLDLAALQGTTAMLVTVGQEAVYHRLLQEFGYNDAELRAWIPAPAHQPWWLLQNMSGFGGPVSTRLLDERIALGRKICRRARELGIEPVFPGYFGTVPGGFVERNPKARVVPQGEWVGFERPDWLDPTSPPFADVAAAFYRHQRELFGDARFFKMDLLHEGGKRGDVDVPAASRAVQQALERAHPGACWVILGWQKNPAAEVLQGVDRERMLIVDGIGDRYAPAPDRERDWNGTPYAFGSIANFGGHVTFGAKANAWVERFHAARRKPGNALRGIAWMPEGAYRDAAAMELFNELAWRETPIDDLPSWFARYARFRYGAADAHAERAWRALAQSVYQLKTDEYSEPPDSLFCARPALDTATAAKWSPESVPYDPQQVIKALRELLQVTESLRGSDAYRLDLVDVARQCLANHGRALLPRIAERYKQGDRDGFAKLSAHWLDCMRLQDRLLATHPHFLLGPWLRQARAAAKDEAERIQFEYDARSILTVWGPRPAADQAGLRDYANREWAGMVGGLYLQRWQRFFASLEISLETGAKPEPIDWFATEDEWAHGREDYPITASGSSHALAGEVLALLDAWPDAARPTA